MEENKNIEPEDQSADVPEVINAPGETAMPVTEESLSTLNPQVSTEQNMEVHHHPHAGKKNFKEYFLEFVMIFLAVTLGFIAENLREHISENSQANELAKSLYEEVYADSITMQHKLDLRAQKKAEMEYFRKYVMDSDLVHVSGRFYPSVFWTFVVSSAIQFVPNDGILEQMKNSGSLRLFKNVKLQTAISRMNVATQNVRNRNSQEDAFIEDFSRPFMQKFYDFDWEDELTQSGTRSGLQGVLDEPTFRGTRLPQIRNLKEFDRRDAEALATHFMLLMEVTILLDYNPYIKANHELLQELRNEYHLEKEN